MRQILNWGDTRVTLSFKFLHREWCNFHIRITVKNGGRWGTRIPEAQRQRIYSASELLLSQPTVVDSGWVTLPLITLCKRGTSLFCHRPTNSRKSLISGISLHSLTMITYPYFSDINGTFDWYRTSINRMITVCGFGIRCLTCRATNVLKLEHHISIGLIYPAWQVGALLLC